MRQDVKDALKTRLEELTDFTILPSAYATALEQVSNVQEIINSSQLPAIIIDLRKENRLKWGDGYQYTFNGSVIVLVANVNLDIADEELTAFVSGSGGVLEKLFESPSPAISGTYLEINISETSPGVFREADSGQFYLSEIIPLSITIGD